MRTIIPVVIELANRVEFVKSVTIAVGLLVVIQVFSYVFQRLQVADVRLFGSYTFGNLLWLIMLGLTGAILFDFGDRIWPFLTSVVRKRYKGKRALHWDVLTRAITRIGFLIVVWLLLISPVESLVDALRFWIYPIASLGLYHILFALAVAYCAVSGAIQSKATGLEAPESLSGVSWDGLKEAVKTSEYLKRLEALKSSGRIDEKTYDKLRAEYESKLRAAIELTQ
jgi:hypothetical protein